MENTKKEKKPPRLSRAQRKQRNSRDSSLQLLGMLKLALGLLGGAIVLFTLILIMRPSVQYLHQPEIQQARNAGVLRVGILNDAPGFAENNAGLEVELARLLCRRIFPELDPDITLELVHVNDSTGLPKLDRGAIDILFAKHWIRNANIELYTYSSPYFYDAILLLCRPGDENALVEGSIGMVDNSGAKAVWGALQKTSTLIQDAKYYASYEDMLSALRLGDVRFLAVPSSHLPLLEGSSLFSVHREELGALQYVAVSALEKPSFVLLTDLMLQDMQNDGTLSGWINYYGLHAYEPARGEG